MKVILQKDVLNVGDAGEVKEVADGYARNFLLPRKLAVRANAGNTKAVEHQKKLSLQKRDKRTKEMKDLAAKLEGKTYELKVKVGEKEKLFGSVTASDIAIAIKKDGFEVDKRKIDLQEPIRALGESKLKIKLAEGITPAIVVRVAAAT